MKMSGSWRTVADIARTTIGKSAGKGEPSDKWKKQILLAEHSPIRSLMYRWQWGGLKSWISVHFVRHKIGIEHFVSTQRSDRTMVNRDEKRQDSSVNHECIANAQAIITISRKRLCKQSHSETRDVWEKTVERMDPIMRSVCVPECIYRGFCPEFKTCGYAATTAYLERLSEYRKI